MSARVWYSWDMERWVPARIGDRLADVDTPALVVDAAALERNLERMQAYVAASGRAVRVRPHAKGHKSVAVARRACAHGAVGVAAQKVGEAEPFILAGVPDVLVTNEIVGERKVRRLAALAAAHPEVRVGVCVDALEQVSALAAACAREGERARLDVYVEIDVGQRRAGVTTDEAALALARAIGEAPGLTLRGLHAYHGGAQHVRRVTERRAAIAASSARAAAARDALLRAGHGVEIVTGAGTGSFPYDIASGAYDEIQPGSYALMDLDYARNEPDASVPRFEQALTILSTVMSVDGARATLDAGAKAQSTDCGPAQPTFGGWSVRAVNDEHMILDRTSARATPLVLGDKVRLVPSHVDPTVNMYDAYVVVDGERVIDVWPIEARGRFD
ncbi:MAG: DSD1 family PLP-dependent enzyme [Polyangiaceae bacterium]